MRFNIRQTLSAGKYTLPVVILLYAVSVLLFRLDGGVAHGGGVAWDFVCRWDAPVFHRFVWPFVAQCLAAYLLLELNTIFSLVRVRTLFPITAFVALLMAVPFLFGPNPGTPSALLVAASLFGYFFSYQQKNAASRLALSGFYLALASLFTPHCLWLGVIYLLALSGMGSFSSKNAVGFFLGLLLPYWLLFALAYYTDGMDWFVRAVGALVRFEIPEYGSIAPLRWIQLAFMTLLFICAAFHFSATHYLDKIRTRFFLSFVSFLTAFVLLYAFVQPSFMDEALTMSVPLLSILLAHLVCLVEGRGARRALIVLIGILLGVTVLNFFL